MVSPGKHTCYMIFLFLFISLSFSACSEKITSVDNRNLELKIQTSIDNHGDVSQVTTYILTVSGTGIEEPIVEQLVYDNGLLTGTVTVPAGPKRRFRIEAFDESGTLMYAGQTVADVMGDSRIELRIKLYPQIPMIKISPIYMEKIQGALLAMKVMVYNVKELNTIEGLLSNEGGISQLILHADSVVINPEIADFATLTWWDTDIDVYFKVEHNEPGGRIVDDSGYAELFTAYYKTWTFEIFPAETVTFHSTVISLRDMEGYIIPGDDVYRENATAVLYDYSARLVAHWHMGWGSGSENWYWVEDVSGNNLHGTAVGTTAEYYGIVDYARFFDGDSDFIVVPDNDLLDIDEAVTISMWCNIYPQETGGLPRKSILISKRAEDGPINYQLLIEDVTPSDGIVSILFRYGGRINHTYRADIKESLIWGWRQIIFSYRFGEPSSALLVLDNYDVIMVLGGAWVTGDGRESAPISNQPVFIGMDNSVIPWYYRGILDEVRLFDIALDIEEIKHLFQR